MAQTFGHRELERADDAFEEVTRGVAPANEAGSPYLTQLAVLANELAAQAHGRADATVIRLLRQRVTEWVEDLRSVGGHDALADAVEHLVQRLSAALTLATDLVSEAIAVAAELAKLASGVSPPPRKSGRLAFWK